MAIKTSRLMLRRARIEDLPRFHAIMSDPRAMRYWSSLPHETMERTREWLQSMIDAPADASDDYVIEHEGQVIGKAGCWRLPEIGFILDPDCWGKGLAREAMEAVIGHIFATRPVETLIADVDPRNQASLGLLKRLGFRETSRAKGTWTIGEEVCDSVYLALARS
ncbi:MAG TPA: GNAT family N-acetyltransferase [Allosphingosinicella sp.]|nr:GNAT family N-acetyltransferase [Allosphingosinicella sp.]